MISFELAKTIIQQIADNKLESKNALELALWSEIDSVAACILRAYPNQTVDAKYSNQLKKIKKKISEENYKLFLLNMLCSIHLGPKEIAPLILNKLSHQYAYYVSNP